MTEKQNGLDLRLDESGLLLSKIGGGLVLLAAGAALYRIGKESNTVLVDGDGKPVDCFGHLDKNYQRLCLLAEDYLAKYGTNPRIERYKEELTVWREDLDNLNAL